MLKTCPECDLQVSDKAISCPHCGYPIRPNTINTINTSNTKNTKKSKRRRRLPNGFGQISEIKNKNLRKPFRAMITVGKDPTGRPICKLLKPESYFETYNAAYEALVKYNQNPYDLDGEKITIKDLYDRWSEEYFKTIADSSVRTITSAWGYCSSVENMKLKEFRIRHIKMLIENASNKNGKKASPNIKSRIKFLLSMILDYAVEYELIEHNFAKDFSLPKSVIKENKENYKGHIAFTNEEISLLWSMKGEVPFVEVILFQCYGGWRPQEIGLIELQNVHLEEGYIVGGMKTEAGKDRIVPIHPLISDIVKEKYNAALTLGSKYLFNCTDTNRSDLKMTYEKYRHRFDNIVSQLDLNPEHRAHDGRKHFITMAKAANMNEFAIKRIVGHAIQDVTEKIYTERDVEWLKTEMKKIK